MDEFILHVLLVWGISASFLILLYDKVVVQKQMEHNMYRGKRGYNKKKAKINYLGYIVLSGLFSVLFVYLLQVFLQ